MRTKDKERGVTKQPPATEDQHHPVITSDGGRASRWTIKQASQWSGIGEHTLREMAKANEIPCIRAGRRIIIPCLRFMDWFNSGGGKTVAA